MSNIEAPGRQLRKSTLLSRSQDFRPPSAPVFKDKPTRNERSRRYIFKGRPQRAPIKSATNYTVPAAYYNGQLYCIGDVVAVRGQDNCVCYAQITGLLIDRYGEKSASLAWLVPSTHAPKHFDPDTYLFGELDNLPRKLDCLHLIRTGLSISHFKSGLKQV